MKHKIQWVTTLIFLAMILMGILIGCSAQHESAASHTDPTQISQYEPNVEKDDSSALQQVQQQNIPYSKEINYPHNWKEISNRRAFTSSSFDAPIDHLQAIESGRPIIPQTPAMGRYFSNERGDGLSMTVQDAHSMPSELAYVSADEVWVIVKPSGQSEPDSEHPGCGAMLVDLGEEQEDVPLPLKHTDVKGQIYGYIASVNVTQQFHNPFDTKIEAEYVFPLPQNAAVDDFIMTIGERKIRGVIREREEAEKIYAEARAQGYVTSLLTQERPNIFTQKVANIEPGKDIDVSIHYFNTLAYADGWYEFVFPMVVGPRYNPPCTTDGVGAVAYGSGGISGQSTEVQYLTPNQRSGHDIALSIEIDAGTAIENLECTSHVVSTEFTGDRQAAIAINPNDSIPNKDFVLRYKVAGSTVKSALVTHSDGAENYFTMMLYPPEDLSHIKRASMEMIFVLDCSGSMSGYPIETSKAAIKSALKKLQPNDTFQVIRFSSNASQLGPHPVLATKENIQKAIEYVEALNGSGGTQMIEGIKAALDFEHDPDRLRLVSFMTDGYIGNEAQILAAVYEKLGTARIFSFGVGNSVNRYLLDRMAKLGKGAVAYIGLDENPADIVDLFYDRISHPALTDIEIDWGNMAVGDVFPAAVPDLFVGRPVILTGKFNGTTDSAIRITGTVGNEDRQLTIPANTYNTAASHEGVAAVWARKKIEQLNAYMLAGADGDFAGQIKNTALQYGLMSSYTAFIAVDSSRKTEGDHGVTVAVPVPVPDGVRYDTTVKQGTRDVFIAP